MKKAPLRPAAAFASGRTPGEGCGRTGGRIAYWGGCRLANFKKNPTGAVAHKN